jgi:predicted DNA-binding protein YlxM (UPF0122 family)
MGIQEQLEARDLFDSLMAQLSPIEARIIELRYVEGYSMEEIAVQLQMSVENARQIMFRTRARVRERASYSDWPRVTEEKNKEQAVPIQLIPIIETIKNLTPELIKHLQSHHDNLDDLRWDVFEHLIAEFFASWGWEDVRLVGRNHRTSADIFAAHIINPLGVKIRYFIEVKRWKHKVGVQIIDQVYGAMISEKPVWGWHAAMIVSLVGFKDFEKYSREAIALRGIELKDRNDLLKWLKGYKRNKNGLWLPQPLTDV